MVKSYNIKKYIPNNIKRHEVISTRMKICYLVLTCEKYVHTRVQWQRTTMFKHISPDDIYYLGHKMDVLHRIFSWGAKDDYNSLPYKLVDFFTHIDIKYDWYVLIDDDTFVFHDRLVSLLSTYSPTDSVCIGKKLDHVKQTLWEYYSGGAGTVLSHSIFTHLCTFVRNTHVSYLVCHWCADICLGWWIKQIPDVLHIDHPQFHTDTHQPTINDLYQAITFHHLTESYHYLSYDASQS